MPQRRLFSAGTGERRARAARVESREPRAESRIDGAATEQRTTVCVLCNDGAGTERFKNITTIPNPLSSLFSLLPPPSSPLSTWPHTWAALLLSPLPSPLSSYLPIDYSSSCSLKTMAKEKDESKKRITRRRRAEKKRAWPDNAARSSLGHDHRCRCCLQSRTGNATDAQPTILLDFSRSALDHSCITMDRQQKKNTIQPSDCLPIRSRHSVLIAFLFFSFPISGYLSHFVFSSASYSSSSSSYFLALLFRTAQLRLLIGQLKTVLLSIHSWQRDSFLHVSRVVLYIFFFSVFFSVQLSASNQAFRLVHVRCQVWSYYYMDNNL